ncbi:MAG: dihydrolipoyl dehydrogenase [bacterium]
MPQEKTSTQVAVIGGGPGGYVAGFRAADLGLSVTIVDTDPRLGGVCLQRGCIPSKALLHIAKVLTEARESASMGVEFAKPKINLDKLRQWKDGVVGKMTRGLDELSKRRNVRFVQGRASFEDPHTLKIQKSLQDEEILTFEHAILASGSRPASLPQSLMLDSPRILNSTTGLDLEDIPKTLLVIGGGYIGLELGTVYAALGSEVSVVEMMPSLLPGADRDLVDVLRRRMDKIFSSILVKTKVVALAEVKDGIKVQFEGDNLKEPEKVFEKVLVAVGCKPNSSGLGLSNTKIQTDEKGFVKVDAQRRTHEPSIFAIGDVAGEPMLAHKASHEGRIAAEVIAGRKVSFNPKAIPAVVFTDPELAWAGITEAEARAASQSVKVARFPWAASGRATTLDRSDGMTKLIFDPESERILGVGIVGPGAGELISEGVLAIEMAAVASDLGLSIHPHPTLSETMMESAELFFGSSTHIFHPKRK